MGISNPFQDGISSILGAKKSLFRDLHIQKRVVARVSSVFTHTSKELSKSFLQEALGTFSRESLEKSKRDWANRILDACAVDRKVKGHEHLDLEKPCIFVGNHIGYLDIPILMSLAPVVFVAKAELEKWPLFGACMKRVGTVFVSREDSSSRRNAAVAFTDAIQRKGHHIAIFPAGTTSLDESKPWRLGAFKVAMRHGIDIQPFRLRYTPARAMAYIDDDVLMTHLCKMLMHSELQAEIEFRPRMTITAPEKDAHSIYEWTRSFE